ncbi:MAG TPA: ATP-binding protein [Vicinamibacterales bacterium]|nr:ATP-binding protein [Vicinamibacterales bacterium]
MIGQIFRAVTGKTPLRRILSGHFGRVSFETIATAAREFPITSRVEIQTALEEMFRARADSRLIGLFSPNGHHETPTLAQVFGSGFFSMDVGPLQHDEVDIGEHLPVRCLRNGLWLSSQDGFPFALLVTRATQFGQARGVYVEIAVPSGDRGLVWSQELFSDLERRIGAGRTYRGRIISLEQYPNQSGSGGAVKVHRLARVERDNVILPARTLALLDANVAGFVAARDRIKALRFSGRKGLLFYGPPGTGKTHTIHYLASQLPEHTTFLITAEQVVLLGEYFRLARFLQPAMIIVEDVDLIARERTHMHSPFEEIMLNKLLNEIDGLREDADVLVVMTTNRPDQIEPALASRPGRIDQAIEFPLPDEEGRRKLVHLYARGLEVPGEVVDLIVRRTDGVSPAFIKELMRRTAQFHIEAGSASAVDAPTVERALEQMIFSGGTLNLKLLGGSELNAAATLR